MLGKKSCAFFRQEAPKELQDTVKILKKYIFYKFGKQISGINITLFKLFWWLQHTIGHRDKLHHLKVCSIQVTFHIWKKKNTQHIISSANHCNLALNPKRLSVMKEHFSFNKLKPLHFCKI